MLNPRMHWWGEEPFPWIGVALGLLAGPVLMMLVGWGVLAFVDCDLGGTRPHP